MQSRFVPKKGEQTAQDEEEWRELNARWFEFATFCPLLRVHGELRPREMWTLGDESSPAYQAELKFDRLRYAMFPYIYSLAGAVTRHDSTITRPLVMDFPADQRAYPVADEYMFGPAFLVAPVTHYKERSREVYLPGGESWYDLWTGKASSPGIVTNAPAPYDAIPVFVRAGSIVPFGPVLQYIGEEASDPITVFVYGGANGEFTLYEDDGVSFAYERGAFAETPLNWNEAARTLTIGQRQGSFPGMPEQSTFRIVLVSKQQTIGFSETVSPLRTVSFNGSPATVSLP